MKFFSFFLLSCIVLCACQPAKDKSFKPVNLKCENMVSPLGVDIKHPRFSWMIHADSQKVYQFACRVFIGTDSTDVKNLKKKDKIWDSGEIFTQVQRLTYNGNPLQPETKYWWVVRVKNEKGRWSEFSDVTSFETGKSYESWKGNWITDTYDYNLKPAPYFRKEFSAGKKIKSARAYIAAAGLFELYLNGKKAGDHFLDPMYTRFDRRTLYVVHDVTQLLSEGKNTIGVILGNGWYNHQSTAVWYFDKAPWRARPKFCLDLKITYDDNTDETISTGDDWKTSTGPIIFNSIYTGEHYDARKELSGWDINGYEDKTWKKALLTGAPSQNMVAQVMCPIRQVQEIKPVSIKKLAGNTWVFDFGRNMAGVAKIKVAGSEGTEIRLKYAEKLDSKGFADQSNINVHYRPVDDTDPFQTDIFILSGKGTEEFMPRFNYKGFQYVEVSSNKPVELNSESLTAFFMHSDVPPTGEIKSSNPVLDKIWMASNASYLSNLFGYPTDCPQREKNGWTGDAQINIETGLYNFDAITVYEKWLADHRDEQLPNGVLPAIIPTGGWGYHWANGPDWTSTIAIIPWNVYLFYGDDKILRDNYLNIKRYVDHITSVSPDGLTNWGLGDWVPVKSRTPKEFTSSIYYYTDVVILSKIAQALGNDADARGYRKLAASIREAINKKYLNIETGIYGSGFQTELSAALKWGIVPENLVAKVASNLVERVKADSMHIDVGLLGTKTILNALSENGYPDVAYQLASSETYPSWGWWIVNGATTFYENWPLDAQRDMSLNHIMFGEINAWFYKALGGIFPDESKPGFKNVILKPNFVSKLEQFSASHTGPYGKIISEWKHAGDKIDYSLEIPTGSMATLFMKEEIVEANGKSLRHEKGIKIEKTENGFRKYLLKSGSYHLIVSKK